MSGHSKWSTIKHKKGAADAKRGKLFSKIVKEITVAARNGGDPEANPRLRLILQKAKDANMPSDNITRAIKRGTGEIPGVVYEEKTYEGYGPGGIGLIIETLSDNKNRTSSEVRSCLDKNGGNMAQPGAVSFQFETKGLIVVKANEVDEEKIMDLAIESGAQDFQKDKDIYEITTDVKDYWPVKTAIENAGITIESSEVTMIPNSTIKAPEDQAKKVIRLIEALEDLEDVQNVYANLDISDDSLNLD